MADMEAVDTALGAIRDDGIDASPAELDGAIAVFDALDQTAVEAGDDDSDAYDFLVDARDSLEAIAAGEADESDVQTAEEGLETLGQQMQVAALKAALAGAL